MSRGGGGAGKAATAKRVPPPAVPGDAFGTPQHRHSGSSFGSQGYASCEDQPYPQPPDTPSHTRGTNDHNIKVNNHLTRIMLTTKVPVTGTKGRPKKI